MMTDFLLASLHHVLFIVIASVLAAEMVLIRPGMPAGTVIRLARLDMVYGIAALALIVVGVCRVVYGLKGWEYYSGNHAFWTKMALFVAMGLLSIRPTLRIAGWRRTPDAVDPGEIAAVRKFIHAELTLLILIPIAAAAMARQF